MASMRMNNNKTAYQTKTVTRFCKFCKDAGKSEAIYSSHHLRESRDPNSRVVCPELLKTECRSCFKFGHTVNHCPKYSSRGTNTAYAPVKKQENKKEVKKNMFDLLDDDVSDDDMKSCSTDFPSLSSCGDCDTVSSYSSSTSSSNGKLSYSQILSIPIPQKTEVIKPNEMLGHMILSKMNMKMKNWADYSDSD
jgi:hypothetical protein